MNKLDFYKEFGNVDDKLILEADLPQRKKLLVKPFFIAASLLVVILTAATFALKLNTPPLISPTAATTGSSNETVTDNSTESIVSTSTEPTTNATNESTDIFYNETDKAVGSLLKIPGHFWQELSDTEKFSVFGSLADKYTINATANFSKENKSIQLFDIRATVQIENNLAVNLTTSQNQIYDCYVLQKDSIRRTKINGVSVVLGIYKTESSAVQTFFAELNIDNVNYFAEMKSTEENEPYFSQFINELTLNKNADLTIIVPVVPELKDEKLTLDETYADSVFGSYIPKSIPTEYKFESARRFINQEYNYLSVLWCCGLNDISFRVGYATDYDKKNITSVEEVKNYDLSLYPIPRGESVPEELWEIVQSPVFKAEDLSEDVISKRVTEHSEDGKTVKKINFSLIFDNDIVITISTADLEPKEVYEMLIKTINNNR